MKFVSNKGLWTAIQWLQSRFYRGALILLYHRVAEVCLDPFSLCVTPRQFAEHLEFLKAYGQLLSLQEMLARAQKGNLPPKSIAITFDDGYADNLENAKPILEHYQAPATFFIATGSLGSQQEFWWDELTWLLLGPDALPEELTLIIGGRLYEWKLDAQSGLRGSAVGGQSGGYFQIKKRAAPRERLLSTLYGLVRELPEGDRAHVLDQISAWAGVERVARQTHRALLPEEVAQLVDGNLFEVGAHTVTHSVLSAIPVEKQREEIVNSKRYLEDILGVPVNHFSYPYGMLDDYTAHSVQIVQQAGFTYACSGFPGLVHSGSDWHQLPRLSVLGWDVESHARKINRWLNL